MIGVSIVICTHNGKNRIRPTLDAIANQQFPSNMNFELIIVDNNSIDGTADFVKACLCVQQPFMNYRIIKENRPGKPFALESGYDAASHECIITCDDDNWLASDYAAVAWELMQKMPDVAIIGGSSIGSFEGIAPSWFQRYRKSYAVGSQANESGYINASDNPLWGAGMVLRKSFWKTLRQRGFSFIVGKHKKKAVGEDTELCMLAGIMGYRLYYAEDLRLTHFMPELRLNWDAYLSMCKGFGSTGIYLEYYSECLLTGTVQSPVAFREAFKIRMRKNLWRLIVRTKGRVLLPSLLAEGNKFRAEWVRYLSAYNEASANMNVLAKLMSIYSLLRVFANKHLD